MRTVGQGQEGRGEPICLSAPQNRGPQNHGPQNRGPQNRGPQSRGPQNRRCSCQQPIFLSNEGAWFNALQVAP